MNVVLKLEGFLSWEHVWLKQCDWIFMEHPVEYSWDWPTTKNQNSYSFTFTVCTVCHHSSAQEFTKLPAVKFWSHNVLTLISQLLRFVMTIMIDQLKMNQIFFQVLTILKLLKSFPGNIPQLTHGATKMKKNWMDMMYQVIS